MDASTGGDALSKGAERPVIVVESDEADGIGSSPGAEKEKVPLDSSAAILTLVAILCRVRSAICDFISAFCWAIPTIWSWIA